MSIESSKYRAVMIHCLRIMVGCAVNYNTQLKNVVRFTDWAESLSEADRRGLLRTNERGALESVYKELRKLDDTEYVIYAEKQFWATQEWQPTLAAAQKALDVLEANYPDHCG